MQTHEPKQSIKLNSSSVESQNRKDPIKLIQIKGGNETLK